MRTAIALAVSSLFAAVAAAQHCPPVYEFTGDEAEEHVGQDASDLGDLNGDGIPEIGVSAWSYSDDTGEFFVYSGADGSLLHYYLGEGTQNQFSHGATGLGDVDGDGFGDFVVAAPFCTNPHGIGRVYMYSGASGSLIRTLTADEQAADLGMSICRLGDFDGDGVADMAVGAPLTANTFGNEAGRVYVYSGATGGVLYRINGRLLFAHFGGVVSNAGDTDGDGYDEIVVTENKFDYERGRITLISPKKGTWIYTKEGLVTFCEFGTSTGGAGDLNGDGVTEIFVSEPDVNGDDHVYFFDSHTGDAVLTLTSQEEDGFGFRVADMGDLDGDAVDDFSVANPNIDTKDGVDCGRIDLFSGASGTLLRSFAGEKQHDHFGRALAAFTDFNGDERKELLAGAPDHSEADGNDGRVDLYLSCAASWQDYGDGFPGTYGVPALTTDLPPQMGHSVTITVGNSSALDTCCILVLGATRTELPTSLGGTLLVAPFVVVPFPLPAAGSTMTLAVPDDPAICGQTWDAQTLQHDHGAARNVSFSAGLEFIIGE